MGKSDPFVFDWYLKNLPAMQPESIAVLGSTSENFVRKAYPTAQIDLYDLQLGNWEINSEWNIDLQKYDLVVCTRCAYFSKDPADFIQKCKSILKPMGWLFVDWGLGDHWRFKNYKVGWLKDREHEYAAYNNVKSYVMSAVWNDKWEENQEVVNFKNNIEKFGYKKRLIDILREEIPSLLIMDEEVDHSFLSLWEDSPQLYIITKIKKNHEH